MSQVRAAISAIFFQVYHISNNEMLREFRFVHCFADSWTGADCVQKAKRDYTVIQSSDL